MCKFDGSEPEYRTFNNVVFGSMLPQTVKLSGASLRELSGNKILERNLSEWNRKGFHWMA
ncbi:hypothetical protein J3R73_004860 [Labrys monachus]|uniref:Uncharacterized protein n=1 Tax=Labrys monachus TaxID=217067 RepID=A0ABU0FKC8_9HYPH|nr:hypothetical protein [Labrys monachus]